MVEQVRAVEHREEVTGGLAMAPSIATASASSERAAVAVLTLAFAADPVVRWLYRDPHRYLTYWPEFVMAFGGRAFERGTAYRTTPNGAAALWLPPGTHPDEETLVALLQESVAERDQAAVFGMLEQMDTYHPNEPHWYLPLIGVDPLWQGRGLGTALLRHTLAVCDRDQTLAYLESSNPRNIALYERHGFEVVATIQVRASPPLYPMVRIPRPVT